MTEQLSPKTAEEIAALKTKQVEAENAADDIIKSSKYQKTAELLDRAKSTAASAADAYAQTLANLRTTPEQIATAKAAFDSANNIRSTLDQSLKEMNAQIDGYRANADSYKSSIDRTASLQTTSPTPTLDQDENTANEAGNKAATQASENPVPVRTVEPPEPPYNPTTDTTVTTDEVQNRLIAAFETTPIRADDTQTVSNDEVRNLLRQDAENIIQQDQRDITTDGEIGEIEDIQLPPEQQVINVDPYVIPTINAQTGEITTEGTTINPSSDPSVRPGTQIFDDGSTLYYNPNTGETITTDTEGNTSSSILIPTTDSKENNSFLSATSSLPTRNQQMAVASPKDWRFRISLSPSANYLYKDSNPGILRPLQATNGVIYPYTPSITVNYVANYSSSELTHSNYKIYNYKNSSVETINIVGDFTVQDSAEANYVLAVIHFFKSVTKMFYGQDQNPIRGTPPPLVYLTGFGQYQFDMHPVVITNFTHTFPTDVDYVNAYPTNNSSAIGGQNMQPYMPQIAQFISPLDRLRTLGSKIRVGGTAPPPTFINSQNINEVTRVPSKINIQLTCLPIVTRNAVSNTFSLRKYASGELMRGSVNFGRTGGGMW
jgi:hypothetical protein